MSYPETVGLDLFTAPFQHSQASMTSGRKSAQAARSQQAQAMAAQPESSIFPASRPDTAASTGQESRPEIPEKLSSEENRPEPAQSQPQKGQPKTSETASEGEVQAEAPDPIKKQSPADTQPQPESPTKELIMDMSADSIPAGKPLELSEEVKSKAHEEAEAKRRAEWDAKQRVKKEAEEEAVQKLQNMSDDEIISASTGHINAEMERITRRNMKECVADHIQDRCRKDPAFARRTMYPRKSMGRCFQYITRRAKDYIKREMEENGIRPDAGGYGSDVPDGICYQWAEEYFNDTDAPEDQEKEERFVPRPYPGPTPKAKNKKTTRTKKAAKKETNENNYEQMSLTGVS